MSFARLVFVVLVAATACVAQAKGIFQAQGRISEPQRSGDSITFRYVGWISSGYATAPDSDPKRRWRDIGWDKVDVPVTISEWTVRNEPGRKDERPDVDAIYSQLREMAAHGHRIMFSVDNPGLFFSNRGQLVRVSGTRVYAHEMPK